MGRIWGPLALLLVAWPQSIKSDFMNSLLDVLDETLETEYDLANNNYINALVEKAKNYSILSSEDMQTVQKTKPDPTNGHQKQSSDSVDNLDNGIEDVNYATYTKENNIRIRIDQNGNRRVPNLFKRRKRPPKLSTRDRFLKMRNRMNSSEELVHSHSLAQPTTQWTTRSTTTTLSALYLDSNDFRDEAEEEKNGRKRETLYSHPEEEGPFFENFPKTPHAFESKSPERKDLNVSHPIFHTLNLSF